MVSLVMLFFVWVEIHKSEIDEMSKIIKKEMEGAWKLRVPLRVDIGMGKAGLRRTRNSNCHRG